MTATALPETCATASTLWVSPATAVYLGASLGLAPHSTSVHCLVLGVDGPVTVRVDGREDVVARSVLVPPRVVHRVVIAPGSRILFCYNDANADHSRTLVHTMRERSGGFGLHHSDERRLLDLCAAPEPDGARILATAFPSLGGALDERIARTVERILHDPTRHAADALAQAENLSRAHFLRLFGGQTGTSFRRYRLWARMLHAAAAIADGADLTRAAAEAGFASPSHFSDSFLRMFGLTATTLTRSGARLVVSDAPAGWRS
ncbi:Helix-turn-helix, AraC domain protein OS=Tsukamurella paurometabola (strain ATCC 8368 / DSM/ CCUG 35730 / CIP 100753 / JCM 10117 / KCTC 9821 / NBRC 16120/ NCIMB 702349 / NCTC 13040) OX=521096 GN=Tpau_2731 PE=4 SV=1 [Tsukamurella paurometabola]|uniref:Helix-turn-helix, AraC domain protein n=1 Tax=Tsukamurella paurometabola (strain ATCC 8368 / DSM 20162 / CCUG 35730 / CIP 100753 / JCM 10117 / KCTC 9821 / NBRC 16120 / NCIMB 702349 / NCTC 13040) TaxID=521096 RepID=D5USQ8_TSUPD|nr:AraC family transcriptional regulator [Tsukamurella paurometabola]ADG79329.1 Helix-turn-helix, AraC domain protein [Tsukamurella paurometabola DSM 20162]SUP35110.1 bifunctional DNA-binding transcriptional dual regulator/O6-methylguanine-DNA methyltransferase [Tsukamurella paurometabola]